MCLQVPQALPNLQHGLQAGKPQFSTGLGGTKPLGGVLKSPGHLQTAAAADEMKSSAPSLQDSRLRGRAVLCSHGG